MPIKFFCPKCRQKYAVDERHAGRKIRCEKCSTKMRVPEPAAQAEEAAPDSEGPDQGESSKPFEKPPELKAALQNLLVDDEETGDESTGEKDAGEDVVEGGEKDAGPTHVEFSEAPDENEVTSEKSSTRRPARAGAAPSPGQEDSPKQTPAPPPADRFSDEEEDEEEEDFYGGSRAGEDEEMDLTPMVDVTFLLLIFFMITASFSIQKSLEVPPPEPEEKGQSTAIQNLEEFEEESIMVEIDARNLVMVDEQIVSDLNQLPKVLKSARKPEILIMAHEDCLHEVVVRVIDASNEIGLQKIRVGLKKGN